VKTIGLLEVAGFHASHPHVTEDREEPQGVQRAALREGHQLGPRADRELDHADLEELRDQEVPGLVGGDQKEECPRDGHHRD
jgi:hypothetical protein